MNRNGWQVIGRIAKERRERLGLNQDELAQYGGPRVSTVGKFERAAQESFPLRTQHQMEKALGWSRGIVEQVVASIDDGSLAAGDWEHDLVVEDVPDLSQPEPVDDAPVGVMPMSEALEVVGSVLKLTDVQHRNEAVRAALLAVLPFLSKEGATELGRGLRDVFPPDGGDGDADDTGRSAPTSTVNEGGVGSGGEAPPLRSVAKKPSRPRTDS